MANEKLLKRLYVAAQNDIDGAHYEGEDPEEDERRRVQFEEKEALGEEDARQIRMVTEHAETFAKHQMSYDVWKRVKEHQTRLRKVLVYEAKKDLYEKLMVEQAKLDQLN